jgi:hypothetical protein
VASYALANAQKELLRRRAAAGLVPRPTRPPHRRLEAQSPQAQLPTTIQTGQAELPDMVRAYPALLAAFQSRSLVPAGRVLLLLQAMDGPGLGILKVASVRHGLTSKQSLYRVFSWKRLRQILNDGEGLLWHRNNGNKDRIWLHSPAKIALALDCGSLKGRPVYLPLAGLTGGIQEVRAHFLAAWHTGRGHLKGADKPISQGAIKKLTGVSEASQRRYAKVADIKSQRQIAVSGLSWRLDNKQKIAHERGRGVFRFLDNSGLRGPRGRSYVAWAMPNIYEAPLSQAPKGRLKKINQTINLVSETTRGHDGNVIRIYHPDGSAAGKAFNRDPQHDHYWPKGTGAIPNAARPPKLAGVGIWEVLSS